jgi:hypothetical protein
MQYENSFNNFIQMKFNFHQINSFFSSFRCHCHCKAVKNPSEYKVPSIFTGKLIPLLYFYQKVSLFIFNTAKIWKNLKSWKFEKVHNTWAKEVRKVFMVSLEEVKNVTCEASLVALQLKIKVNFTSLRRCK